MSRWLPLIIWLFASLAGTSSAEIYRWTDSNGRMHFTQSLNQVPPPYRKQARTNAGKSTGNLQTYDSGAATAVPGTSREFKIPFRRENSLMRVSAVVNGHLDVPFYVDTGASGISIPAAYAERLGIRIGPDTRRVQIRTANGIIAVPFVQLDSVKLGGAEVEGLMATINPTMNIGLLGGTFFNHFTYGVDPSSSVISLTRNHAVQAGLGEEHWRRRFSEIREPLDQLKHYLETREITRKERREELEERRADLEAKLQALMLEANRVNVPASWRR